MFLDINIWRIFLIVCISVGLPSLRLGLSGYWFALRHAKHDFYGKSLEASTRHHLLLPSRVRLVSQGFWFLESNPEFVGLAGWVAQKRRIGIDAGNLLQALHVHWSNQDRLARVGREQWHWEVKEDAFCKSRLPGVYQSWAAQVFVQRIHMKIVCIDHSIVAIFRGFKWNKIWTDPELKLVWYKFFFLIHHT